ncbi:MAG: hypothetical protein L5657_06020, partial [Calditerricola sp.]|nr:hypothetical protein [Calditerricola sp.]
MVNAMMDSMMSRLLQDPYTENLFAYVTVAQKLTPRAIVEAAMRAESGKPLSRPLGSPIVLHRFGKSPQMRPGADAFTPKPAVEHRPARDDDRRDV